MAWKIELTETALRDLKKIEKSNAERILTFLYHRIAQVESPREIGKALHGKFGEYWRYRVGPYRILCDIHQKEVRILVIRIGHRDNVYKSRK